MRSGSWQAPAAVTLAGTLLRFATIDVQSYWFDEALTAQLLSLSLGDMLGELPEVQLTPPLYYLLAWPWAELFGTTEPSLRTLSALFGIATVPVAWAAARELAGERVALVAALLTAFNPLLVWYSQEARPYSLLVLLGALSFLFFARFLRSASSRDLALWSTASLLALLTHYFAVFLIVPEALWLLARAERRARVVAAGAPIAAAGVALIPLAREQAEHVPTGYISDLSFIRRALGVPEDFLTGFVIGFNTPVENVLAVLAAPLALLGLWLAFTRTEEGERRAAVVAATVAGGALGLPFVLAVGGVDYLNTRNLLAAWLPVALVLALGYGARRVDGRIAAPGVAALCAIGVATTVATAADETLHRSDWRGAAEALGEPSAPRALAVPGLAGFVSLERYQDGMGELPPGGAAVREVALVTVRNERLEGSEALARAQPPPPPAPGLRLVEARYEETYTLIRYRSGTPVPVTREALAQAAAPVVGIASLLVQE